MFIALAAATATREPPRTTTVSELGGSRPLAVRMHDHHRHHNNDNNDEDKNNGSSSSASSAHAPVLSEIKPPRFPREATATPSAGGRATVNGAGLTKGPLGATRAAAAPPQYPAVETYRQVYLAGAAYCDKGLDTWQCLYCNGTTVRDVMVFGSAAKNVRGYVGWDVDRGRAVISFRGTEPSSFVNWLENLDATHAIWQGRVEVVTFFFSFFYKPSLVFLLSFSLRILLA